MLIIFKLCASCALHGWCTSFVCYCLRLLAAAARRPGGTGRLWLPLLKPNAVHLPFDLPCHTDLRVKQW